MKNGKIQDASITMSKTVIVVEEKDVDLLMNLAVEYSLNIEVINRSNADDVHYIANEYVYWESSSC